MEQQEFTVRYISQDNIGQALNQHGNTVVHSRLTQLSVKVPSAALSIKTALNGVEHYRVNGEPFTLTQDRFLLVRPGDVVECEIDSERPVDGMCYYVDPTVLGQVDRFYSLNEAKLLDQPEIEQDQPLRILANAFPFDDSELAKYLITFTRSLEPGTKLNNDWFYQLAVHLLRHQGSIQDQIGKLPATKRSTREELYKRLLVGKAYLEAHLNESVTMDEVARKACLSTYHFIRRFRQAFGNSPYQYLLRLRMEKAAQLLTKTEWPIRHIAHKVGMPDIHLFSRQFKRFYENCPSQYRVKACA